MPDRIVLIGMMGAGKTTVGQRVAARLGWVYIDSDEQVVATTGRTVREIFETDGEAEFRRLETEALRAALSVGDDAVISVAGGAVLEEHNRELLSGAGTVVWLRAPVDVLAVRAARGDHRPLLAGDARSAIERLYPQRAPFYESLADVIVDVSHREPNEIVDLIVDQVMAR